MSHNSAQICLRYSIWVYSLIFFHSLKHKLFIAANTQLILASKKGNIVFSPFSIHDGLSLIYEGSGGNTTVTMAAGLKLSNDTQATVARSYRQLLKPLQNNPSIRIANRLYYKRGYQIRPAYSKIAKCKFFSAIQPLNFAHSTVAANLMNTWVSQQTNNKIKMLVSPDSLTEKTRLVLVNAMYFKQGWATKFPVQNTKPDKFYTHTHKSVNVDMMHVKVIRLNDLLSLTFYIGTLCFLTNVYVRYPI